MSLIACPDCGCERTVTRGMVSNIKRGIASGRCRPCAVVNVRARTTERAAVTLASGSKTCCVCKLALPLASFSRSRRHRDGLSSRCRSCNRAVCAANYAANRQARLAASRDWDRRNRERRREIVRNWNHRWKPHRRRAGKVDFAAVLERDGMVCHLCGRPIDRGDLHFDHVVPLARGGAHHVDNVKPSHALCNLRKGTKLVEELVA